MVEYAVTAPGVVALIAGRPAIASRIGTNERASSSNVAVVRHMATSPRWRPEPDWIFGVGNAAAADASTRCRDAVVVSASALRMVPCEATWSVRRTTA